MKKQLNILITIYIFVILFSASISAQTTNASPQCTNPVISSVFPATGPVGTTVTITGSGFQTGAGISSVKFGGVSAASYTVISDTSLKALVPANANNGSISATTETCTGTGGNFTVTYSNCSTSSFGGSEIYISELYDQKTGSGGMVELYNPTNNAITLTGTYVLQRYGNISDNSPTPGYILNLNGTIDPESTFLVAGSLPNPAICIAPPNNNDNSFVSGFNDNDKIELLKNGQRIDIVNTPSSQPGFTMIRKPDAVAPAAVYNNNDWNIILHNDTTPNNYCDNLGSHGTTTPPAPSITMQPVNTPICPGGDSFFEIAISAPAGFTYQWKILNAAGNWANVVNNANYSGATTNKLILNDIPASFGGNQYYCVATLGTCVLVSNAVQLPLLAAPAAPVAVVTQPTCTSAAIITVTPVTGVTYSIDGINYQTSNIFNNVAANTYNVIVKNAAGCVSPAVAVTVNPAPGAPAAPVAVVTQATCTSAATITVTPVAGVTYSIDGINYQSSNIFNNVVANTYNVTVKNAAGCVSPAVAVTVNPAPGAPGAPVAVVTQPTCTTPATITVTPVAGVTYSIDGINYQASNIFNNVAANTYNVTIKNAAGCVSPAITVTVNQGNGIIPEIGSTEGCRETISGRKYILEALPLNNSFDIGTSAFEWRDASGQLLSSGENTFDATGYFQENTVQFPLNIRVKVTANGGCSQTFTFTINGIFCDVPKGISPNNDSKNDSFNLAGLNVSRLLIYNRYGKEVYSKNNYVNEWHGQGSNDNELPTGTYYYIIEASGTSKTGWVYINREN